MFWNSFEMPKKSDVASFVGNLSPVKRRRAIFVRRIRHRRGEIGDELNNRARFDEPFAILDDRLC